MLQIDLGPGVPQRVDRPIPRVVGLQALVDQTVVRGAQAVDDVLLVDREGDVIELDDEQDGGGVQDEVQVLGGRAQKEEIDDHHEPGNDLYTNAVSFVHVPHAKPVQMPQGCNWSAGGGRAP